MVERWARIATFVPENFWTLEMTIKLNADGSVVNDSDQNQIGNVYNNLQSRAIALSWKRVRLYDRTTTAAIHDACLEAGEAIVISLTGRPKNKWRPVPLATVELQKRASKYLRIGSEDLMSKAEELYNQGYISYPRTETEKFRPEFDHHTLIQSFQAVAGEFGDYASRLLMNNNFQNPRAGQNDDNAHPPITPAKAVDPESIADPIQRKIYSLIVQHYLACCSRDAVGRETELSLKIASEEFVAKGLMIIEKNWLEIYQPWERWSTGQGELPKVAVGSRIRPTTLLMKDGRTNPPQPISEAELIAQMDRNGIGTDATIATHISTICDRRYAEKDGNQCFHPTKLGIALVEGYNSMGYQLNKPDLRRDMEAECSAIAAGRKSKDSVLVPVLAKMLNVFKKANEEANKLDVAVARHFQKLGSNNDYVLLQPNFSHCGTCNEMMALKQHSGGGGQGYKVLHCSTCSQAYMMPKYHQQVFAAKKQGAQDEPLTCPICYFQIIKCENDGNAYHVCPKCFSEPPENHGGDSSTDFPCSKCTHPSCSMATGTQGGDIEVFTCPFCSADGNTGSVSLKRSANGYRLSCSNGGRDRCQYVIWLPKAAREIMVQSTEGNDSICQECTTQNRQVRRIKFVWKQGSVPPHYDQTLTTCILCDDHMTRDMEIRIPKMNQVQARSTASRRGGGRASSRVGNSRSGRVNADSRLQCFQCGGPHYANACPKNACP